MPGFEDIAIFLVARCQITHDIFGFSIRFYFQMKRSLGKWTRKMERRLVGWKKIYPSKGETNL